MPTAKQRFEKLDKNREGVMTRARDCADITIPVLMPPIGADENTVLTTPYQSLGARGVNNISSKLVLALLPTGNPFFRFFLSDEMAAQLGADKAAVEEGMRKLENAMMKQVETGNLRTVINIVIKLLVVTGNALLHVPDEGSSRVFRLNQYVCIRDPMGTVIEGIIKESVHPTTLSEETRTATDVKPAADSDESVEVYTHIKRDGKKIVYHQEINEKLVPGSEGRNNVDESPYIFLRWNALDNEDYGRGHCEEYLGDLRSMEGLSKSIITFAAAVAKIVFLEHPNSVTDSKDLRDAESGEFVTGRADDIDVLHVEKFADFQVAKATMDDLTLRLSQAFLLTSGTIRNAERVTAEEIRLQAQELEDVLGGVYTVLSQELQLPLVRRLMVREKKKGTFPKVPKGSIEPSIVTGFDALGRGHELNRYRQYFSDGLQLMPNFMDQFSGGRVAQLLATQHNVDVADLTKTEEEIAADQQQAMAAQVVDKGTGPAVSAAGQIAVDNNAAE